MNRHAAKATLEEEPARQEEEEHLMKVDRVRVGRVTFEGVLVKGREAAINFEALLLTACEKTKSFRLRKDGTRYPEPLPMGAPARLLSAEIEDYLNDMGRRNLGSGTVTATRRSLDILKIACGDIPVSRIDHKHIYQLWDLLRWAPPFVTTDPKLRGLSAEDLIARGKKASVPSPADASLELHRRFLVAFFNALVKARAIPYSPMAAFAERKKDLVSDPSRAERLFTDEDLQRIFDPGTYVPWARKYPHRWWGPAIGLHTGARINEVAQMKVADVVQERDVWCFAIRKTIDADLAKSPGAKTRGSVKGRSAIRFIPIAQALLDAGFLEFVADIKACGHLRLFPHLSAGVNKTTGETNARYSQGLLNQFGRYLKDLGFPKGVGFHAFRHTLATDLDQQGIRVEDVALITGHSLSKKAPTLEDAYLHRKPEVIRKRQMTALELYKPAVELPKYRAGQFREALRDPSKFYP